MTMKETREHTYSFSNNENFIKKTILVFVVIFGNVQLFTKPKLT